MIKQNRVERVYPNYLWPSNAERKKFKEDWM